jgi:hypothetical protein
LSRLTLRFKTDPGLFVALLLATFAAWPFLTRAGLPTFTDAELHVYRVYEVMEAWKAGVLYPRWAPDLFYAYGYPVFHYYAPLTYHLAAAYGFVFGGPLAGMKFALVSAAYLGAAGMYLLVRDRWGSLAGVAAAAAFILAPYVVYVDPHARGAAPETFAIGLAPLMLWAFARLRRRASAWGVIFAAVMLAALTLSHNLMSFVFLGLLGGWLAWEFAVRHGAQGSGAGGTSLRFVPHHEPLALGAAILLGLGLSAFMWLPAILERHAVQFHNAAGGAGTYFDFHKYFIRWEELFAPSLTFDLGATQMRFNHNLGPAQWVLAALGALSILVDRAHRRTTLYFALAALGLIFLMTRSSVRLWESFPPIAFLQFPTRLLGPAAVTLGILAGASVSGVEAIRLPWWWYARKTYGPHPERSGGHPSTSASASLALRSASAQDARRAVEGAGSSLTTFAWIWRWGGVVFAVAAVAACIAGAMPLLYPPPWGDFGPVNPGRIIKTERDGRGVGTTSGNEFLPVGVAVVPGPRESLWASYSAGVVDKINRAALPEGTTVTVVEHGPQHDRFAVSGAEWFLLRPYTFYWPGWTAYVDGARTRIEVAEPDGWITFMVPPGAHDVLLKLEDTPPRTLGWVVSGLSLLGLLGVVGWGARVMLRPAPPEGGRWPKHLHAEQETLRRFAAQGDNLSGTLDRPHALILGALILAGIAVRFAADRAGWWWVRSTGEEALVAQHQQLTRFENDVALLGFDLPEMSTRRGDLVPVTLYWKALAPLRRNLRVFVHFLGPDGNLWGQSDKWNPADFPMNGWPLDLYVRDEHDVQLRLDAPPGVYTVRAGLYDENGVRMRVLDADGNLTDQDGVVLTTEFVVRP